MCLTCYGFTSLKCPQKKQGILLPSPLGEGLGVRPLWLSLYGFKAQKNPHNTGLRGLYKMKISHKER